MYLSYRFIQQSMCHDHFLAEDAPVPVMSEDHQLRLLDDLFKNYNKIALPVINTSETVNVYMSFSPIIINNLVRPFI